MNKENEIRFFKAGVDRAGFKLSRYLIHSGLIISLVMYLAGAPFEIMLAVLSGMVCYFVYSQIMLMFFAKSLKKEKS